MFFDSHCHLTSEQLAPHFDAVLERAQAANVTACLNIADDFDAAREAVAQTQVARARNFSMWATAGVHPIQARRWNANSEVELRELLHAPEVVAVGEIGLDFFYDDTHPQFPGATRETQEEVLRAQLQVAQEMELPVVLHNREADDALLQVVSEYKVRGVFHCWASPPHVAERALEMDFSLGFTGMVTFKNAQIARDVVRLCPLERLLIETDAPYLAPVPHRGKTNEPAFVARVAEAVAELKGVSTDEIARITNENARRLFALGD